MFKIQFRHFHLYCTLMISHCILDNLTLTFDVLFRLLRMAKICDMCKIDFVFLGYNIIFNILAPL